MTLVLTLVVMIGISWQITLLALLLPVFVLPARRMGTRLARLQREAANHNAVMSTQMTERFSAPGATLVKLFGRPAHESAAFAARARRVRDIGVRTAMVQSVFVTAFDAGDRADADRGLRARWILRAAGGSWSRARSWCSRCCSPGSTLR